MSFRIISTRLEILVIWEGVPLSCTTKATVPRARFVVGGTVGGTSASRVLFVICGVRTFMSVAFLVEAILKQHVQRLVDAAQQSGREMSRNEATTTQPTRSPEAHGAYNIVGLKSVIGYPRAVCPAHMTTVCCTSSQSRFLTLTMHGVAMLPLWASLHLMMVWRGRNTTPARCACIPYMCMHAYLYIHRHTTHAQLLVHAACTCPYIRSMHKC